MGVFVAWLCLAFIVGYFGKGKNIGFGKAFFWSLILSPLVGLVIVLFSSEPMEHQYAPHYEAAKKFDAIGKSGDALIKYKEAAYHLENDYQNVKLSRSDNKQRLKMIDQIKAKISTLEAEDSDAKSSD